MNSSEQTVIRETGGESEAHVDECERMSHTHSLAMTLCTLVTHERGNEKIGQERAQRGKAARELKGTWLYRPARN